MKPVVYYLSIFMLIGCIWQSCSNEETVTLQTDKTENLSMQDVLQKYLDAGFKIDPTATDDGEDTFETPEEALEFLELFLKEKKKYEEAYSENAVTRTDDDKKIYSLALNPVNSKNLREGWLGTFQAGDIKVSIITGTPQGRPVINVRAEVVGTGHIFTEYDDVGVHVYNISYYAQFAPYIHVTFWLVGKAHIMVKVMGMTIIEQYKSINAYCDVDYATQTVECKGL